MNKKKWISLVVGGLVLVTAGLLTAAEYNSPWVKTQALYLNNVLVTSTAAELNANDVTAGTATANKALVLDASKAISTITTLGATTGNIVTVNATNIDAGASGTLGSVDVFPTTASRGKFSIACTDQTGDTAVTLNANAMGQATTVNIADPGIAASYVVQSTGAISLAEANVLDAVTPGTATASKALVLGASKEIATITTLTATTGNIPTVNATDIDAGASGTAGSVDVFPTTASHGKLIVAVTDQTADTNVTLQVDAMGQATSVHVPDPGAAASYIVQSTAALTLGEADVLDAVTAGTVAVSKALVVDANKDLGDLRNLDAVNYDAGLSGTAGSVDIFLTTASSGKITISAADSAGDTTTAITNASQAGARTYTIPDAGASANFVMMTSAQAVAGTLTRADLTEETLVAYGIPVNQIMAADGAPLGVTETAGDFFLNLGTNFMNLRGEEANNETETSVGYIQFILPPEYVAAGDVKIRFRCQLDGAGTDNSSTLDVEAFEMADGAVGSDICATAAESFAAKSTYYNKDFTITATGLVAGDILVIKVTVAVIENASAALAFYSDPPKMLLDIKG